MRFLKTLFWVLIAVFVAILASLNWHTVTVNLWGDLQLDIRLPILIAIAFLIGFLPPWLIQRGRVWTLRRRLSALERQQQFEAARPPATETNSGDITEAQA